MTAGAPRSWPAEAWLAYRMRWKRRRLVWRGARAAGQMRPLADRTAAIRPGAILAFACIRNEAPRLDRFLAHHRALGVAQFLIVDNASTDEGPRRLAAEGDVSIWQADAGYKAARYGMDWVHALLQRHGHGHWCLVVDADERLVYPHWPTRPLPALTAWLEARGQDSLGAVMLDLYPAGHLSEGKQGRTDSGAWFDPANYILAVHPELAAPVVQGGVRGRVFMAQTPHRIPTQSKVPLVRWNRAYAFVNSTHALLPRRLNRVAAVDGGEGLSGILLHDKFAPSVIASAAEEVQRRQHFARPEAYRAYYDALMADPVLHCPASMRLHGWEGLETAGLMGRSDWA